MLLVQSGASCTAASLFILDGGVLLDVRIVDFWVAGLFTMSKRGTIL